MSLQLLPTIWMSDAELPRTAENAQPWMRLPRTITLPARWALTPLPYCPEPPARLRDVVDAVVEDDGAVVAERAAQDLDAVVAGVAHGLRAMVRPRAS